MKYLIIVLTLAVSGCASTSDTPTNNLTGSDIAPYTANKELSAPVPASNLFTEAHRCQGTVKYQAEVQNNAMRSRLTCEWLVEPDEWGSWE